MFEDGGLWSGILLHVLCYNNLQNLIHYVLYMFHKTHQIGKGELKCIALLRIEQAERKRRTCSVTSNDCCGLQEQNGSSSRVICLKSTCVDDLDGCTGRVFTVSAVRDPLS
jgi:hypothetical protein